ncbi:MAG: hypothetical protein HQL25_03710 [Candidatus Omnitrophica bacterium]|nr:hypothetical protein [Candidatus Omnitrophota bacterium]
MKQILFIISLVMVFAVPAYADRGELTDSFSFIEEGHDVSNVYVGLAYSAYEKKDFDTAKTECLKALRIDPNNCKALKLMKKLDPKAVATKDRRALQKEVNDYKKQIEDLRIENATILVESGRRLEQAAALAKQNKQTADNYAKDMSALKARFDSNVAASVKYQELLLQTNATQAKSKDQKNQEFYTKNEVFNAVDSYALIQNNKLQEIGDYTLASAGTLQKNADNVEAQKKIVEELSNSLDNYKKNIEEQRKILFRQTHRFELMN